MAGSACPVLTTWCMTALLSAVYVYLCPYTKVEESFNLQAIHDHMHYGFNISEFDHVEFTGPVPRTFLGSLVVGYLSLPLKTVLAHAPRLYLQCAARLVLMLLVLLPYLHFLYSIKKVYGAAVSVWSCLILCSQFHFLFYISRPLPNTFAAAYALLAFSFWLRSCQREFVFFAGVSIIVFRCELAIMFGLMLLISLLYGNLKVSRLVLWIFVTGAFSLGLTVLVDSYYWQKWVWPEGAAFHFNAILNKSSEWGTSPLLWYFYSGLPRAMGLTLLLVPLGMVIDARCRVMSGPALGFVLLYSLLPHKELRFILYVIPVLNVAAARVCAVVWNNRGKSVGRMLAALFVVGHLLANLCMTALLLTVSYHNYPGGNALHRLNTYVPFATAVNLHIDVYSAQTGVSRFLHEHKDWRYDKTEDPKVYKARLLTYTHLLVGTPDEDETQGIISLHSRNHTPVHSEKCYKGLQLTKHFPFIHLKLAPCVWIFEAVASK